jgi:hypothetical protein
MRRLSQNRQIPAIASRLVGGSGKGLSTEALSTITIGPVCVAPMSGKTQQIPPNDAVEVAPMGLVNAGPNMYDAVADDSK